MAIDKTKLLDPVELELQSKYQEQGITYISNNNSVVNRDDLGNIILNEGKSNPLLIIETVNTKILNSSVIKVIDTQFNYFKFPVRVIQSPIDLDLDVDLSLPEIDNVSVSLTIPIPLDSKNQPLTYRKINTSYETDWFYDTGEQSSGYKELQFTGGNQTNPNSYTITKDILNNLKQQNKTLRFKLQVQYRSTVTDQRVGLNTRLTRSNLKQFHPLPVNLVFHKEQNVSGTDGTGNPYGITERQPAVDYPFVNMTYIVNLNDTIPDDVYTVSAESGGPSYILAQSSYWDIDIVDIPDPNEMIYENIYDINNDTVVFGDGDVRVQKTNSTSQEIKLIT
jgi:hypothetical protein|tara:strand:- start:4048 stop:5055 length:1008 start_codon:yes stop_codon:yes gene_type:complete